MYSRFSSTSMIAARVAGVPRPVSFIASDSSFSSSVLPAVSIAVSSVASVKRLGARVFFFRTSTSTTSCGWPSRQLRRQRLRPRCAVLLARLGLLRLLLPVCEVQHLPAHLLHGFAGRVIPVDDARHCVIAVITVVTDQMWSSCQRVSSRRQIRS